MNVQILVENLEKKVHNLEKRMKWIQRDLWLYKHLIQTYTKQIGPKKSKIEQLELFGS